MASPLLAPMLRELSELGSVGILRFLLEALVTGLFSGCIIGLFRVGYTAASTTLSLLAAAVPFTTPISFLILFGTLFCAAVLAYFLLRFEPLISGSGIPQVELMLAGRLPLMRWGRVLSTKFVGTLISLSAGLSLGREGPCIQMGAAAGLGAGHILRSSMKGGAGRFLVGGSSAGMAAAFGAPLAGLFFAFEEMKMVLHLPLFLFCAIASFASYSVVHFLLGLSLVFPFVHVLPLSLTQFWFLPLLGLLSGLCGALYNGALVGLTCLEDRIFSSPFVRLLLPFLLCGLLLLVYPHVLSGFGTTALDIEKSLPPFTVLFVLLLAKISFSAVSFASGTSGGLLMPMLLVGALFGGCLASLLLTHSLLLPEQRGTMLLLGMGGLFASTVRAPLTATALLLEMTGCWSALPALLCVTLSATWMANKLGSMPVYDSLKARIVRRIQESE